MDATLVTVTVLSMGMAAALSIIVWRLLRDERRRSDARVMALQAAAEIPRARTVPADLPLHIVSTPPAADVMVARPLFVEPAQPSPWGNRIGIMAAIVLVAAAALLFFLAAARARGTAAAQTAAAVPVQPVDAGLELMSLRDSHANGVLTITGLVHNPRTASMLSRVTVTAYAFDDGGAFLASGRALLDVTSLAPGDDSPFVVTVPVTGTVARYRIGFRGEDGRVIGHVDRRQQGPIAALEARPQQMHW